MNTIAHRWIPALLGSLLALSACSSGEDPAPGGGPVTGEAASGAVLAQNSGCGSCHSGAQGTLAGGDVARGGVYGPNLTPDEATGLGAWTDAQISAAIQRGTDDEGAPLCASMPRFAALTDQDLADVVAFLRSLPPVHNTVAAGTCAVP